MDRLSLRVEAPEGQADVSVLGSLPVAEVVPIVLRAFQPGATPADAAGWGLSRPGEPPFPGSHSLVECGVQDRDRLLLKQTGITVDAASFVVSQPQVRRPFTRPQEGPPPKAPRPPVDIPQAAAPLMDPRWAAPPPVTKRPTEPRARLMEWVPDLPVGAPAVPVAPAVTTPAPTPPPIEAEVTPPLADPPAAPAAPSAWAVPPSEPRLGVRSLQPPAAAAVDLPSVPVPAPPPAVAEPLPEVVSPPSPPWAPAPAGWSPPQEPPAPAPAETYSAPPPPPTGSLTTEAPPDLAEPPLPVPDIAWMAPPPPPSGSVTAEPPPEIASPTLIPEQSTNGALSHAVGASVFDEPAVAQPSEAPTSLAPPPQGPPEPTGRSAPAGVSASDLPRPPALIERLLAVRDAVLTSSPGVLPPRTLEGLLPKAGQLGHGPQHSALERARQAWLTTSYFRKLDEAIAAPRVRRCVTIAVTSPKGGVGKTTVAILLGTMLAALRRDRVVAIDANPDYGTLGRYVVPDHPVFVDQLMEVLEHPALTVPLVDRSLGRAAHGLMVLPAPQDPEKMVAVGEDSYRRVIRRLQELMGIMVLDCGPGLHHPVTQVALSLADQVVMVSDGEPATASVVVEAAQHLNDIGRPALVVVNKLPSRKSRLDVDRLASHLPQPWRIRVVAEDAEAAARVSTGEFDWSLAPSSWQQGVRELVIALMSEWTAEMAG